MIEDFIERQTEEIEALQAIYGEDDVRVTTDAAQKGILRVDIKIMDRTLLRVHLTSSYPEEMPVYELVNWRGPESPAQVHDALKDIHSQQLGEVVLFQWVEYLRGVLTPDVEQAPEDWNENGDDDHVLVVDDESTNGPESADGNDGGLGSIEVHHGEPFTDRKSTFQAHLAKVASEGEAMRVLAWLKRDRKITRATHNMWAFRVFDENKGAQVNDNDDDGEDAAGGKMAELLHLMGANNVMVVVSRWYGGIQLGPDRFRHINNVSRVLLERHGFQRNKGSSSSAGPKSAERRSK